MPAIGQDTFHCSDCDTNHPNTAKYITKFKDESVLGGAGRDRSTGTHEKGDQICCKPCNRAKARIQRLIKSEAWGEDFKSVSGESRAQLMLAAHDAFGGDLAKLIKVQMEQSHASSRVETFCKGGGFLDADDLDEKYKKKPQQLANIKANANTFKCPIRMCMMYQDPEYVLTDVAKDEKRSTTKRTVEAEFEMKKDKRAKTVKVDATDTEPIVAHLKGGQIAKLKEAHDKVCKTKDVFAECRARVTADVAPHCPKFIIDKAAVLACEFASVLASIDVAVESANGDFKLIMREAGSVMKASKTLKDSLSNILDEAEAHLCGA